MKVLTKRTGIVDSVKESAILQHTMNRLRHFALVPKGLYRFKTKEESYQWMTQQIAATHARRKSKT